MAVEYGSKSPYRLGYFSTSLPNAEDYNYYSLPDNSPNTLTGFTAGWRWILNDHTKMDISAEYANLKSEENCTFWKYNYYLERYRIGVTLIWSIK